MTHGSNSFSKTEDEWTSADREKQRQDITFATKEQKLNIKKIYNIP
jgi:hypothetical protein